MAARYFRQEPVVLLGAWVMAGKESSVVTFVASMLRGVSLWLALLCLGFGGNRAVLAAALIGFALAFTETA